MHPDSFIGHDRVAVSRGSKVRSRSMMTDWWQKTFPQGRQTVKILDANQIPVAISYGEKGSGTTLILVHGIGSWSYRWRYNIDVLARHFRVICFDAKGRGFSDKPNQPEKVGYQVIELIRLIQAVTDEPVIIIAESLGGLITLAAVQESPHLFQSLVVINVPIFPQRLPSWGMQALAQFPLEWLRIVEDLRIPKLATPLLQRLVATMRREVVVDASQITQEDVYWITYPYAEFPGSISSFVQDLQLGAKEIEKLLKQQPNLITNIQNRLNQIQIPTLILWGEKDRWFPVNDGIKLQQAIVNAEFKVIPNCGHDAAATSPQEINQAILEFFEIAS